MLVYKYTSASAGKLIIENTSLRFSQIEVLNDPFEINPSLNLFKKSLKDLIRKYFESRTDDFKKLSFIEKESLIQKTAQPAIDTTIRNFKDYLILSLTKNEHNLLMWSHYADSHHGMVIGFDYDNYFFHQDGTHEISRCYDVKYSNKRPALFDYSKLQTGEVLIEDYRDYFLTKSNWWKYEEEIRIFASVRAATKVKKVVGGLDIYLFNFPRECLKQIIFGSLMNLDNKREISEIAKGLYPHIEILEAIPSESEFTLKFKPYKVSIQNKR